jgi:uncharacterized protein YndB with AHSA1/START domain
MWPDALAAYARSLMVEAPLTNESLRPVFPPLVKTVTVRVLPERAFRRFTAELASWWPLASHSVGQAEAETVVMESGVGGRIVERLRSGREYTWGTITVWDPPRRVAFTWHPGRAPESAQDVEVTFRAQGAGTHVELMHTGFERLGPLGKKTRRGYPRGWAYVLGLFAERRGPFLLLVGGLSAAILSLRRLRAKPSRGASSD